MRIIPRAEWGAQHPNGGGSAPLPATEVWLHHSVTTAPNVNAPFDDDYAAIRTLESIGQSRFGQGISYTWPITPAGLIFEGHSVGRLGAHTGGRNSIARAICFVGNYDKQHPTAAQIKAAAWLLQEAKRQGWIRTARLNGGHRDVKATSCPGTNAYAVISQINALAAGPPITTNPNEEDDMGATEQAQLAQLTNYFVVSAASPGGQTVYDAIWQVRDTLVQGLAALSDDESKILAALRTPVDPAEFAAVLAPILAPMVQAGASPEQVRAACDDSIRQAFARAGSQEGNPS